MKKRKLFKRLFAFSLILFLMIPPVLVAQPNVEKKVTSILETDQVISDARLPLVPKVNSYVQDENGGKIPIKTKATHKILNITSVDGETHYSGETIIELPVKIEEVAAKSIGQKLLANEVYANSGGGFDSDVGSMTQYHTAYWDYVYDPSGNLKYYKWTKMEGYWTRGETRYHVHDAYFTAKAMGVQLNGNPFNSDIVNSNTYYPTFPISNYYTSDLIAWAYGPWTGWPYIYPSEDFSSQLHGTVYGPYGYISSLFTEVSFN